MQSWANGREIEESIRTEYTRKLDQILILGFWIRARSKLLPNVL